MKSQTGNLMIGLVTLALIGGAFGAVLGYQKFARVKQRVPFRVVFEGSALGLHKGSSVNFGGIRVGEVVSLKLDNPRRVVALAMIDNGAPVRKDTQAGLEFQGLTGVAALSLTGGSENAPPVPLDRDGIPVLTADPESTLDVQAKIKIALANVNKAIADNQDDIKTSLLGLETFTSLLSVNADKMESIANRVQAGVTATDASVSKTLDFLARLNRFDSGGLLSTVKSVHEFATDFNRRSATFMGEGRVTLRDISKSINKSKLGRRR